MKHPLCQGKNQKGYECDEMARWVITLRSQFQFNLLQGFACHSCKNQVERNLSTQGERLGYNRVVVRQIR